MAKSPYRQTAADRLKNGTTPEAKARPLDVRLEDLKLVGDDGKKLVDLANSITKAHVSLTMEGASTITVDVEDPHRHLLLSTVLTEWAWGVNSKVQDEKEWVRRSKAVDVTLNGLVFRLVRVEKVATTLTLTFEERAVTYLRRKKGAKRARRGSDFTRGQFVQWLVAELPEAQRPETYIPERHDKQPIRRDSERQTRRERREAGSGGFPDDVKFTIKGAQATAHQIKNVQTALDVADSLNASPLATLALIVGGIGESSFNTSAVGPVVAGQGQARGVWQLMPATERALGYSYRDVAAGARTFLTKGFYKYGGAIKLAKDNPHMTPGEIASRVEGSATDGQNLAYYNGFREEAQTIIRLYGGYSGQVLDTRTRAYRFTRKKGENSWDCMGRLAEEVRWRRFMRLGRLWFVSEEWLFNQKPELRLVEGKEGVDQLDYDVDLFARGKNPVAEVRATARASRWRAIPGMVVLVEGQGPADGRWIVASVERDLCDASGAMDVVLRKPLPKLKEPAPEKVQRAAVDPIGDEEGVDAVIAMAKKISDHGYPYIWGGGHRRAGTPDNGTPGVSSHDHWPSGAGVTDPSTVGFDCSGYTAACLVAGGFMPDSWKVGVPASGTFASSWGKPGLGKRMTVWANGEHVWIQFHREGKRADTSPYTSGPLGPKFRKMDRSTAGFTPRHWPGT